MILLKPNLSWAWSNMSDCCRLFNCILFDNYNLVYIYIYVLLHAFNHSLGVLYIFSLPEAMSELRKNFMQNIPDL